jgi:hypothetical protein
MQEQRVPGGYLWTAFNRACCGPEAGREVQVYCDQERAERVD